MEEALDDPVTACSHEGKSSVGSRSQEGCQVFGRYRDSGGKLPFVPDTAQLAAF